MAAITWVVVSDGSRARVFQTPGLKLDLQEIEDLVNVAHSGTGPREIR
jgi:2-phospho-L-lactate guanylyltransferase (CobY/MobA/RfbA family)